MEKLSKKEFALKQIAPYYKDRSLCGYQGGHCVNLTPDGKMCVAGKNLLPETLKSYPGSSIENIIRGCRFDQSKVFIQGSVGVLDMDEWMWLQSVHDAIATGRTFGHLLFTLDELKEYCKAN